ncbi:MAG: hypothetical protein OEY09_09770 [Gammaproteobacteria bacterium]|nr:hypothetical protein [Gammaproteobacteria bacterium]
MSDATHYKLLENPDGSSGYVQVGSDITQNTQSLDHIVPLYARLNASYILQSCNATGCTDSNAVLVTGSLVEAIGYLKASNTGGRDMFGYSVSLGVDGSTLAVSALLESSSSTSNDSTPGEVALDAGVVYVC